MPQPPASSSSTSSPIRSRSFTSGPVPPVAFWWQWPCRTALRGSRGRAPPPAGPARFVVRRGRPPPRGVLGQELGEVERLLREPLRVLVRRPELRQLVAE